jgi:hypothetical protein
MKAVLRDAWLAAGALFVILAALEAVQRGFVSRFFNFHWLTLLLFGLVVLLIAAEKERGDAKADRFSAVLLQVLAVAAALAVWRWLGELPLVWRAAASGGTLLTGLLSWPLLNSEL